MSEFKENLEKVERLLKIAQIREEYAGCNNLYDFLGIDKTATKENIKASIGEKYRFYLTKQNVSNWEVLSKVFISSQSAIEYLLSECRPEYDNYLIALKLKDLRKHFISRTRSDQKLDSEEKKEIIKEGIDIGLSETQIIKIVDRWAEECALRPAEASSPSGSSSGYMPYDEQYNKYTNTQDKAAWSQISDSWEILKDRDKRKAYDKKIKKPEVKCAASALKVICKKDNYYVYKDVKKGTQFAETIVIKNDHEGQLKGTIISDAEWLAPERDNLIDKQEQTLEIHIVTSKIPVNTYDAKGTITIDSNGGLPYLISFRVILEDLGIAVDRFRKTYVPLMAVCAGFIGSFSGSPLPGFLIIAISAGLISYFSAKFVVKALLKNGLNIYRLPYILIYGGAGGIAILTILSHSSSSISSAIKQKVEQEKFNITFHSEKPHISAVPTPQQLPPLPEEAESKQVIADQVDHNQQSSLVDDILTKEKETITLSGKLTSLDSKTVDSGVLWRFSFEAMEDRSHYAFGCSNYDELHFRVDGNHVDKIAGMEAMRTSPNRITLYFRSQDWERVQKCSKESDCEQSICPLAIVIEPTTNAQNALHQSPLTEALKRPGAEVEPSKTLTKNTRIATGKVKKKKWKPKTSSFAPPSRDDL